MGHEVGTDAHAGGQDRASAGVQAPPEPDQRDERHADARHEQRHPHAPELAERAQPDAVRGPRGLRVAAVDGVLALDVAGAGTEDGRGAEHVE